MSVCENSQRIGVGPVGRRIVAFMSNSEVPQAPSYSVMFVSVDGSVPSEIAARLLNRCAGKSVRAFAGSPHSLQTPRAGCLPRDPHHADFIIYLHNANEERCFRSAPNEEGIMHWYITGLMDTSSPDERSLRRTEAELETRIKLFVLVHERKKD